MVIVCCVCQKMKKGNFWIEDPPPRHELLSHGYCPTCAAEVRKELSRLLQEMAREAKTIETLPQSAVA